MEVTPACYSHFTSSLMGLAEGKIAVFLEVNIPELKKKLLLYKFLAI